MNTKTEDLFAIWAVLDNVFGGVSERFAMILCGVTRSAIDGLWVIDL